MPLIAQNEIPILTNLLSDKGLYLYHSCQLIDFKSYLELGGIPSRNLLEQNKLEYTRFETDENDKENEVWNKVFLNLTDFGENFAFKPMKNPNTAPTPNPYEPISIQILPKSIEASEDMCLSLKSAGAKGFDREKYGIPANRIEDIFVYIECDDPYKKKYIRWSNELREVFEVDESEPLNPEINLTIQDELISFNDNVVKVSVDAIEAHGKTLFDSVEEAIDSSDFQIHTQKRRYSPFILGKKQTRRKKILSIITNELANNRSTTAQISKALGDFEYGNNWITRVFKGDLEYILRRYLNYLKEGTIDEIRKETQEK